MATGYLLSEADREALQQLLAENRRIPTELLARRQDPLLHQAPEVYIARTRVRGIPSLLDDVGTGTGSSPVANEDRPGSADCDIYRIIQEAGSNILVPVDGLDKTVYNLSVSPVGTFSWILIARDKFGQWIVTQTISGSDETIHAWAKCTISGGVVTVRNNQNIPLVLRLSPGRFLFLFSINYGSRDAYTITWGIDTFDTFEDDYQARTPTSCILATASGTDPVDSFDIVIHGKVLDVDDAEVYVDTGTGTMIDPSPYTCNDCDVYHSRYCLVFSGIGDGDSNICDDLLGSVLYVEGDPDVDPCSWNQQLYAAGELDFFNVSLAISGSTNQAQVIVSVMAGTNISEKIYSNIIADGWDCHEPRVLTRVGGSTDAGGVCINWPATITVYPYPCTGGVAPAVTFSDDDLCQDNTTIQLVGTNFDDVTPGNNVVTFNLGAAGTVTTATATLLTVTFTTLPTSLGALTVVVVNGSGSSAPAVQVATIIDCTTTPPNGIEIANVARGQGVDSLSISIVVPSNGLLIIQVATVDATDDPAVVYDGVPVGSSNLITPFGNVSYQLRTYSVNATAGTFDLDITVGAGTGQIGVIVQVITGLVGAGTLDQGNGSSGIGTFAPVTGPITTTIADEGIVAALFFRLPTTSAFAFSNGFTTTAQDIVFTVGADTWQFVTGKLIVNTTGTYEAQLIGDSPTGYGGVIGSYS